MIIKELIEAINITVEKLDAMYKAGETTGDHEVAFDSCVIELIEHCLRLKISYDFPDEKIEFNLHDYLTLSGGGFAYAQGRIELKTKSF